VGEAGSAPKKGLRRENMEKAMKTYREKARIPVVVALAVFLLALPARAQSPVTLAGGGALVPFPPTPIGQSATATVTLNVNASVTLVSFSATGDFALENSTCNPPVALVAGDSCVFGISFTPSVAGSLWSPLLITDNNGAKHAFGLTGSGIGPILTFTPGIASTVAGTGVSGYSGDGGPATSAQLNLPMGMVLDNQGNLYIADFENSVIRKFKADGTISTVAGNGTAGYSGDGGPATSAQLSYPAAVALDGAGNLYIGDFLNSCVRKVDANGMISTLATGFLIRGVAADSAGNVYYSSWYEGVWKVDSQGVNTKIAGNGTPGFSGDGGPATDAQTSGVVGIALDSQGNLYFAEIPNSDIRKVDTNGIITTVAGSQQFGYSGDGGPAISARLNSPTDVRIDAAGDLYIVDSANSRIRKVNASGTINSIAGGNFGYAGDGGLASNAQFAGPIALTLDEKNGRILIADTGNSVIREVKVDSTSLDFGTVTAGQTGGPLNVIVSNAGNADLHVSSVTASSTFGVQTTCSANTALSAGEDCSVDASFTPSASGNIAGTVNVSDDAPGHPHVINLKGQGYVVPAVQLVFANQFSALPLNGNPGVLTVNATDANGNLATGFNGVVILQLQGPAGFTTSSTQATASGGTATFDLSAVVLNVAGSYSIAASSSGLTSAHASFTVVGTPSFSVSPSKQSLTVASGGASSLTVTVTPTNGFSGTIALSCSGLPAHSTCSYAPASLNANGSNTPLPSVLTISTGVTTVAVVHPAEPGFLAASTGAFGVSLLGLVFAPMLRGPRGSQSRHVRLVVMILGVIILCSGLIGCGALVAGGQTRLTPLGSYTVTITAASTGVSHSSTVTLVVQ